MYTDKYSEKYMRNEKYMRFYFYFYRATVKTTFMAEDFLNWSLKTRGKHLLSWSTILESRVAKVFTFIKQKVSHQQLKNPPKYRQKTCACWLPQLKVNGVWKLSSAIKCTSRLAPLDRLEELLDLQAHYGLKQKVKSVVLLASKYLCHRHHFNYFKSFAYTAYWRL